MVKSFLQLLADLNTASQIQPFYFIRKQISRVYLNHYSFTSFIVLLSLLCFTVTMYIPAVNFSTGRSILD